MTQRYILGPIEPCTEMVLHRDGEWSLAMEFYDPCGSTGLDQTFNGPITCNGCGADATDRYRAALIPAPETREERFIRKTREALRLHDEGACEWNGYMDDINDALEEYDNDEG